MLTDVFLCIGADLLFLDSTTDDIDGVLRHNDTVVTGLEHLLDGTGILLRTLDQNLLLGIAVLTQKGGACTGFLIVIQQNGFVLLNGNAGGVDQDFVAGEVGCRGWCAHLSEMRAGLF